MILNTSNHNSITTFFLTLAIFLNSCSPTIKHSSINYDVRLNNQGLAIVHLNESLDKQIDTAQFNIIADSLYQNRPALSHENTELSYIVRFYYREDWRGNMCYAIKSWNYKFSEKAFFPSNLEVTGTTGNEKQDEINYNK